jgi:hypothetical protein
VSGAGKHGRQLDRAGSLVVVIISVALVFVAPVIGVFAFWLALNHLVGTGENVPFSRYPMFAEPSETSWALRFESASGEQLNIARLGILGPTVRKRFATEQSAAMARTHDRAAARTEAAEVVADWIRARRPADGPLATESITIVLVEYEFDRGVVVPRRTVLTIVAPP